MLDAELDDDIDQEIQQVLDVRAREFLACATLLDEEHELLKASSALAAWMLVIDPGWPLLTLRR